MTLDEVLDIARPIQTDLPWACKRVRNALLDGRVHDRAYIFKRIEAKPGDPLILDALELTMACGLVEATAPGKYRLVRKRVR